LTLDEPKENEVTDLVDGLDFLIAEDVRQLADKSTVDYISGPYGQGFTVEIEGLRGC
jgi:hypothetical protein